MRKSGGTWALLGRLLKTWGSVPLKSDSYLLLPSSWTEILIDIDMSATFDTMTGRMSGCIFNIGNSYKGLCYQFGGRKQSGFSVMLKVANISSPTICIWDVYDFDGNAKDDNYYDCDARIYYR